MPGNLSGNLQQELVKMALATDGLSQTQQIGYDSLEEVHMLL